MPQDVIEQMLQTHLKVQRTSESRAHVLVETPGGCYILIPMDSTWPTGGTQTARSSFEKQKKQRSLKGDYTAEILGRQYGNTDDQLFPAAIDQDKSQAASFLLLLQHGRLDQADILVDVVVELAALSSSL